MNAIAHRGGRVLTVVLAAMLALAGVALIVHGRRVPAPPPAPPAAASLPATSTATDDASSDPPKAAAKQRVSSTASMARSRPTALDIPSISLKGSPLTAYGLDANGVVAIPDADLQTPAGWVNTSPTPGEMGPSVIVGHVDSKTAGPSVFYKLGSLKPGQIVSVTRADGTVARFKIDGVEQYHKAQFPTLKVYGNLDYPGLRLITCGGPFNRAKGHYEDNIVVYARLIAPR